MFTKQKFKMLILVGASLLVPVWLSLAAAPLVDPTPLWTGESNANDANLSEVALGDFNGDGYADLVSVVGNWTNPELQEGALFVWHGSSTGLGANGAPSNADWKAETNQDAAHFQVIATGDVNGDGYDDLIASSIWYSNGQSNEGVVFVWLGSSTGLGTDGTPANADWTAESNVVVGLFGSSLTTGDFNGDGYADLVIGASSLSNGQSAEGRAFVYFGSSTGLGVNGTPANADWTSESNQASAAWGGAVTTGDFNGDTYADLAIGAARYDNGETDEGVAFVFFGSSTGLGANGSPANADWNAQSDQADARLGSALAAGDVNGDGYEDLAMAARQYDNGETNEGMAFVFHGSSTGLGFNGVPGLETWHVEANQVNAYLGTLAIGDENGDGFADLAVGVEQYDNGQTDEGLTFVWYGAVGGLGSNGTPANADYTIQADQATAQLGSALAFGPVTGTPLEYLAVGAMYYTNGQSGEGAIFVFAPSQLPTATPTATRTQTPSPTATRTATPTATFTVSPTLTPSSTSTGTQTPTPTQCPEPICTATPTPTATNCPQPICTATPTPTATNCPEPICTATPTPTATNCPQPICTATPTPTATNCPTPICTATPTPSTTPCPITLCTATPTPTVSVTPGVVCPCGLYLPLIFKAPPPVAEIEPNDLFAQAQTVTLPVQVNGRHDGATNTGDVYQFALETGQTVRINLVTENPLGIQLVVYHPNQDELIRTFTYPYRLEFTATQTGTYYVYVFTPGVFNNLARYQLYLTLEN